MDKATWLKYYKIFESNTAAISLIAATAPFLVAYIITILFTNGHISSANYIIQQMGVYQIWTLGLLTIVHSFAQIILLVFVLNNLIAKSEHSMHRVMFNGLMIGVGIIVLPIIAVVGALSGLGFARVTSKKGIGQAIANNRTAFIKYLALYIAAINIFVAFVSFPQVPFTEIKYANGKSTKMKVLTYKDGTYFGIKEKSKALTYISAKEVKSKQICFTKISLLNSSISEYVSKQYSVAEC